MINNTVQSRSESSQKQTAERPWEDIPRLDLSTVKKTRWVIDLFLAKASLQLVYGAAGTRKTTAMLLAGSSVAKGIPFLGRKTRRRCVLYLDYENPPDVVKAYCRDLGIKASDTSFAIWDRSVELPPMPSDEKLIKFVRHCKATTGRYPWIIFDSWTSLLKSGDSGDKIGEAAPIFRAIRHLCDMGATCTIIDHTGKGKRKDPIGTSAKMTQMDTSHFFSGPENDAHLVDQKSSTKVIRVASFLKRYAPNHVGTFSFEVFAAVNHSGAWHLRSFKAVTDISVVKAENAIDGLRQLIRRFPSLGQEELAIKAATEKIVSRNAARQLLQAGTKKHWRMLKTAKGKQLFRVLKRDAIESRGRLETRPSTSRKH